MCLCNQQLMPAARSAIHHQAFARIVFWCCSWITVLRLDPPQRSAGVTSSSTAKQRSYLLHAVPCCNSNSRTYPQGLPGQVGSRPGECLFTADQKNGELCKVIHLLVVLLALLLVVLLTLSVYHSSHKTPGLVCQPLGKGVQ